MKLKDDFIFHEVDNETILVSASSSAFSGIVRGNRTFGEVLKLLKDDTTEEQVCAEMRSRFEAPEGLIEKDVDMVLSKLRSIGALDE